MRKNSIFCSFLGTALLAAPALPIFAADIHPVEITPGIYEICAATDTGFVLDVETCTAEGAENEETSIQMFRSLNVNQQKFYVEQLPGSRYRISALNSGRALSVNETEICLKELQRSAGSAAASDQTWYLENAEDGTYYFVSAEEIPAATDELLVDDKIIETNSSTTGTHSEAMVPGYLTWQDQTLYNGTELCLDNFTGSVNQKWILKKTWISEQDTAHTDFINPFSEYGPYGDVCLMMKFGKEKEVLTSEDLAEWVVEVEHTSDLSADALISYAQKLADKYDTQGHARRFMTSYGKEITLYKGNFGWKLDVEKNSRSH